MNRETHGKNIEVKKKKQTKKKKHKFLRKFILFLFIILIITGGYLTTQTIRNGGGLSGLLSAFLGQTPEEAKNLDPISVLILGSSQNLTDTIMIAKYNPQTQQAYLVSVPRDTFVGTYKNSATASDKINSIYQGKYPEKTLAAINKVTGLKLENYIIVDTEALKALVDAIGGVDFNVPINMKYTDKKQGLYINLKKGNQHLDGDKAEQLVRFRHNQDGSSYSFEYGDNDIGRMKTQRNFLKAVIEQTMKPENVLKIGDFIDISKKYVKTNMSFDLLKQYIPSAVNFNVDNLETGSLPGSPEKCNGVWLYIANESKTDKYLETLNKKLAGEEIPAEEDLAKVKIELLNGSGKSSILQKVSTALRKEGYTISKISSTNKAEKTTIINKTNISNPTINNIKDLIGAGTVTNTNTESTIDITIILGKDIK